MIRPHGAMQYGLVGSADPGAIRTDGASPGVLAIHGFTGTPNEVRLVTQVAGHLGLRSFAPVLPGHGTSARDLQSVRWEDWAAAVDRALDDVATQGGSGDRRVLVAGLSLGSVLALHLAATRPDRVAAVAVLACAAWLPLLVPTLPLTLLSLTRLDRLDLYVRKLGSDIADPSAHAGHVSYGANPLRAAAQLVRGGRIVRRELGAVRCPVLVVHGAKDRVCPPVNARRLGGLLGSRDVETVMLPRSAHIVTVDYDREVLADALERFFRRFVNGR